MVKTRSHDGDSKGKELDVEDPMESRLSRLEDLFEERIKMMKQFADMVKALAGQQLEELQSSNVLLEEKSKPQFQVISDPFTEPLECASNLKVSASAYGMDSHVKEMEEFPHQSTNGSGKKIAHQLFDQMPSKEKQRKCLKAWRFKFKRKNLTGIMLQMEQYKLMERRRRRYKKFSTNIKDESRRVLITGNHRRMVRQLHISRVQCKMRMMNDSRSMRRLTLTIMKSHRKHKWKSKHLQTASNFWINHPHKLADLVLRTVLTEQDMSLPRVDWRPKNSTPFVMQSIVVHEMVPMQDNETVTKTYLGQTHELQDTTGSITKRLSPPVICYHNCRRRFCSLTWYSSASLEEWKHKLEIDLCGYKNQILQLSNHDVEMQMLPCLQRFSVVRMGIHVVFCLQELKPIWWVCYNEAVGVTSTKQELSYWSVANHVKRDAQESFGSKGLAYDGCVILGMNFAGFERGKTELLAFLHMKVIETRYAIGERDERCEVARDVSMRSMLVLTIGKRESNAGQEQQAVFEQIVMANEWLYQISWVLQQVMRSKKNKFPKRWWFKYKAPHLDTKFFETSDQCIRKRVFVSDDPEIKNNQPTLRILRNTKQSCLSLRANRVWDPGGSLVEDETEATWSFYMIYSAVFIISTMRTWLSKGGGFDTAK